MMIHRSARHVFSLVAGCLALPGRGGVDDGSGETIDALEHELLVDPSAALRISAFSQTTQAFVDGFQQFSCALRL